MIHLFFIFDVEFLGLQKMLMSSIKPIENKLIINSTEIPVSNNISGFRSNKWYNAVNHKLIAYRKKYFSLNKNEICIFSDVDILFLEPEKVLEEIKDLSETKEAIFLSEDFDNEYCKTVNTGFFVLKRTNKNDVWMKTITDYDCKKFYLGDQDVFNLALNKYKINYSHFNPQEYTNAHYIDAVTDRQNIKVIHATGLLSVKHKEAYLQQILENRICKTVDNDVLLVVCKYNEDVSWLQNIKIPYVIYNKSSKTYDSINTIQIPNIGYEEYAYLRFIVENYHALPKRIIFCQGDPFPHCINFLNIVSKPYIKEYNEVQPLSSYWNDAVPGKTLTSISKNIKELQVKKSVFHIDFFNGLNERLDIRRNVFESFPKQQRLLYEILQKFLKNKDIRKGMSNLIKLPLRQFNGLEITPMCYSAIFSVTKEKVLQHEKSYYEFLLDLDTKLSKDLNYPKNKLFGSIMEYMWLELFRYEPPEILYNHDLYNNPTEKKENNTDTKVFKSRKNYYRYCSFSKCQTQGKTIIYCCDYCKYKISEFEFKNNIHINRKCF